MTLSAETSSINAGDGSTVRTDGRTARRAAWVFAAAVVVAIPVILYRGRDQWFYVDDWDFLATRDAGSLSSLLNPHIGHWSTVPILVYRALWRLVGLRHYWPYQFTVIALHVVTAVLLRIVMRRAGCNPWIATAAASLFLVLGAGRQAIVYPFTMTFVGSVVFGLCHLLLADHDGRSDWRDAAGIACGLVSLMWSNVGVSMVAAVGIATALRRGWRTAAIHVLPLVAVFAAWWMAFGRNDVGPGTTNLADLWSYAREMITNAFARTGQLPGVGVALALILLVGAAVLWSGTSRSAFHGALAAPTGLAGGSLVLALTIAYGRAGLPIPDPGTAPRYVYLVTALLLPAIAVAASAIADRWRVAFPAMVAVFLIAVPGNIDALEAKGTARFALGDRKLPLTLAHLPAAREVARESVPAPDSLPGVSIGWLVDGANDGRIPDPGVVSSRVRATAELIVSLDQTRTVSASNCETLAPNKPTVVRSGQQIAFASGAIRVNSVVNGREVANASYSPALGPRLTVLRGPLTVSVTPARRQEVQLCAED